VRATPLYAHLHLGIAYKAACTLGMGLAEPTASGRESPASTLDAHWIDAEAVRRCFWAVWFTQCINADHSVVGTTYHDRVMNLPLPIGEQSFKNSVPQPLVNLSTVLQRHLIEVADNGSEPSVMAELMTLIFYW
jgi:hypothetical protein